MREGWRRDFIGAMKNLKHMLMDHEIFLKNFGGPRNFFLCSPSGIFIFKLRESESKISKIAIKGI